jgi:hypothetical protein
VMGNADVLFRSSVNPSPLPCLVEHAAMQLSHIGFRKRVLTIQVSWIERPRVGFKDVLTLPLV